MKIIESFICGKRNIPELCEDGLVITDKIISVIDGVTAKGKRKWQGKSSGCYAKDLLVDYFRNADYKMLPFELISKLNELISPQHSEKTLTLPLEESPRASIILYNDFYKEVWSYGDCQCLIDGKLYTHPKAVDQLNSALRAFALEYALLNGSTITSLQDDDPGREFIQKTLLMQFAFENKKVPFGYPILNGGTLEPSFLKTYPVAKGSEVILASDGYPQLFETLTESERIRAELQEQDPLCFRENRTTKGIQKGTTSFDDRTYCRFIV